LLLDRPAIKIRSEVETNWTAQPIKERGTRKVTLDLEKIKPPLVVRSIKPGDRFRPLGLGGSKKVGDYLTDRKVEPVFRDEIPVICDAEGIIWLVGFEIDDRVKVDVHTGKVITIEVSDRKSGAAATI
jgi:tRNA(Ile)-lysidine synthase